MKNKQLQRAFKRLKTLDTEYGLLSQDVTAIYQTSAMGQAPECYHQAVEKLYQKSGQMARVWNTIRLFVIPGKQQTLWQWVIQQGLDCSWQGSEAYLKFRFADLIPAITAFEEEK
jgi:hypothetical protein